MEFLGTWFLVLEFPRDLTQFSRISRGEALFYVLFGISTGKVLGMENPEIFLKKYVLNPPQPVWFFSGNSPNAVSDQPRILSFSFRVIKDTRREKAPSNKTPALTKSRNIIILVAVTSNQLFIRGS